MLLSIIIPCYNSADSIEETIKCIDDQLSIDDKVEFITVDDGSKDRTFEILKELQNQNPRIKVFKQKNSGVSVARNFGLSKANGEYVWFFDSDDIVFNNSIQQIFKILGDCNPDILQFDYTIPDINRKGNIDNYNNSDTFKINFIGRYRDYLNENFFYPMTWLHIVKRELLNINHIEFNAELKICEDSDWNFQIAANCPDVKFINTDLRVVIYQINSNSTMNTGDPKRNYLLYNSLFLDCERIQGLNTNEKPWLKKSADHYLGLRPRLIVTRFLSCKLPWKETKLQINRIKDFLSSNSHDTKDKAIQVFKLISGSVLTVKVTQLLYRNIFLPYFKRFVPRN